MNKNNRREINIKQAKETVKVLSDGFYVVNDTKVDLSNFISEFANNIKVKSLNYSNIEILENLTPDINGVNLIFSKETSLESMTKWYNKGKQCTVLNYASGKNICGRFLDGANAQEEALARDTGLYGSLILAKQYYEIVRKHLNNGLYTNNLLYSKNVPVIRNSDGSLRAKPFGVNIITCAAPNAHACRRKQINYRIVRKVLRQRAELIIRSAIEEGVRDVLILGAFGCGVFENKPGYVMEAFMKALTLYKDKLPADLTIDFAIPDKNYYEFKMAYDAIKSGEYDRD